MIETAVRSGRLIRLRQGVYLAADAWPDDPAGRHLALARAVAAANPNGVISHQSAAVSWGLPTPGFTPWHEQPPALTLPAGRTYRSRSRQAEVRVRQLPPAHVVRDSEGWAVTSLARTAIDLSKGRSLPEALVLLDAASRQLVCSLVSVPRRSDFANARLVQAAHQLLTAAVVRLDRSLADAISKADAARESPAESLTAGHLHVAGLPMPLCQAPLKTRIGVVYPDFLWKEQGLVGECDGALKYTDPERLVQEKVREDAIRETGYRVLRWLGQDPMIRPQWLMERISRALAA